MSYRQGCHHVHSYSAVFWFRLNFILYFRYLFIYLFIYLLFTYWLIDLLLFTCVFIYLFIYFIVSLRFQLLCRKFFYFPSAFLLGFSIQFFRPSIAFFKRHLFSLRKTRTLECRMRTFRVWFQYCKSQTFREEYLC